VSLSYVIISAVHNEEDYIRRTIECVVGQTVLPRKWVIVSDSTDNTDAILGEYTAKYDWMELLRGPDHTDRNFSAMTKCVNLGYERIKHLSFDAVVKLDADTTFDCDYFEFLLARLSENPQLGIVGTYYIDGAYDLSTNPYADDEHVPGMCPVYRRGLFEDLGGLPNVFCENVFNVALAQIRGWHTRSFRERKFAHHRRCGTYERNILQARFDYGFRDYYCGNHPVWEIFRALFQMRVGPYVIGGMMLYAGYLWGSVLRERAPMPPEVFSHIRRRQLQRLWSSGKRLMK